MTLEIDIAGSGEQFQDVRVYFFPITVRRNREFEELSSRSIEPRHGLANWFAVILTHISFHKAMRVLKDGELGAMPCAAFQAGEKRGEAHCGQIKLIKSQAVFARSPTEGTLSPLVAVLKPPRKIRREKEHDHRNTAN